MRILFALFVLITTTVSAQSFTSAIEYNDYIVNLQNQIGYKILAFNEEMEKETSTLASMQPFHDDLLQTTRNAIVSLEGIEAWDGNVELKASALALFSFYQQAFANEYKEMMGIVFKAELTDADYARLTEILQSVTEQEAGYDLRFSNAQKEISEKYGFSLDENELQEEIDGN
jgi:hypothetical protein